MAFVNFSGYHIGFGCFLLAVYGVRIGQMEF